MRQAGERPAGLRVCGLIVVLWRVGLRVSEALALAEGDLEPGRGAVLVRHGKGGRRREVGMDDWGWRQLEPWLKCRLQMPVGALFCVINGPTAGRPWSPAASQVASCGVTGLMCRARSWASHGRIMESAKQVKGSPIQAHGTPIARPKTRYARSGETHIAYQVFGEGDLDLVHVPGFTTHLELMWEVLAHL
jgi:hypothetical protein